MIKYNNKQIFALRNSRGFTLIELMITVAIVGILAAVALPAYQDYVARSQVSEGLVLVSGAKPVIAEYYSNHGSYPTASDIGFNGYTGSYVGSTTIGANGAIVATFSNDAHRQLRGQTVTLTPEEDTNTGNLKWSCGSSVDSKFLPTSCSNDGSTGNPGNGGTDPGNEPFNPNFSTSYMNGAILYENGVLTVSGNPLPVIDNGNTEGIDYSAASLGYGKASIDKDGNLTLTMANDAGTGANYLSMTYLKGATDNSRVSNYNYSTADGQTITAQIPAHSGQLPSYISNNYSVYGDYQTAINALATAPKPLDNSYVESYNNAKTAYTNYLRQQKSSGVTLNSVDEYLLK